MHFTLSMPIIGLGINDCTKFQKTSCMYSTELGKCPSKMDTVPITFVGDIY